MALGTCPNTWRVMPDHMGPATPNIHSSSTPEVPSNTQLPNPPEAWISCDVAHGDHVGLQITPRD